MVTHVVIWQSTLSYKKYGLHLTALVDILPSEEKTVRQFSYTYRSHHAPLAKTKNRTMNKLYNTKAPNLRDIVHIFNINFEAKWFTSTHTKSQLDRPNDTRDIPHEYAKIARSTTYWLTGDSLESQGNIAIVGMQAHIGHAGIIKTIKHVRLPHHFRLLSLLSTRKPSAFLIQYLSFQWMLN